MIGDKPLDDKKIYTVATNSFLLNGGDGLHLAKDAVSLIIFDEYVKEAMLESIRKYTAEGKPFEYKLDSRVVIK